MGGLVKTKKIQQKIKRNNSLPIHGQAKSGGH